MRAHCLWVALTPTAQAATAAEKLPMVLVAKQALPVGTIITPEMLSLQPWPKELLREAYFVQTPEAPIDMATMNGRVVRFAVTAGEPVTQGALVAPGDRGFLGRSPKPRYARRHHSGQRPHGGERLCIPRRPYRPWS